MPKKKEKDPNKANNGFWNFLAGGGWEVLRFSKFNFKKYRNQLSCESPSFSFLFLPTWKHKQMWHDLQIANKGVWIDFSCSLAALPSLFGLS